MLEPIEPIFQVGGEDTDASYCGPQRQPMVTLRMEWTAYEREWRDLTPEEVRQHREESNTMRTLFMAAASAVQSRWRDFQRGQQPHIRLPMPLGCTEYTDDFRIVKVIFVPRTYWVADNNRIGNMLREALDVGFKQGFKLTYPTDEEWHAAHSQKLASAQENCD